VEKNYKRIKKEIDVATPEEEMGGEDQTEMLVNLKTEETNPEIINHLKD